MTELIHKPVSVLAVDPGLSGAIARIGRGEVFVARDFKTLKDIADCVRQTASFRSPDHIVVEQVGAMPGQGVCSMFSFGKSTGTAFGSLWYGYPDAVIEEVHPIRWQNWFRSLYGPPKGTPFDSRELALRLLPGHAELFKRKKDHNTADACLMALWKLAQ